MIARIEKSSAFGRIIAPPSKSMAHRYLICGALSGSESKISGLEYSEDIKATMDCLYALGADIKIDGDTVIIGGINFKKGIRSSKLNCRESGSTLRFFIPLALLFDREISFTGSDRLFQRSLGVYEKLCFEHLPSGIDTMSVVIDSKSLEPKKQDLLYEIKRETLADSISFDDNLALIAVVGVGMRKTTGTAARVLTAIANKNINIRMLDQGSSELNIIVGVDEVHFEDALKAIYDEFFK